MRALLAIAIIAAGCAPSMVVPAVGTKLGYESCGTTSQGVTVRRYEARCPKLMRVEERARRVVERYKGCSLHGVEVFVVGAYVICNEESVRGCQNGTDITITADAFVVPSIEHELSHVCIDQRDGPSSAAHYHLDNRAEENRRLLHGED